MLERERQVVLTYTTWRWVWFFVPATLFLVFAFGLHAARHANTSEEPYYLGYMGSGMPIVIVIQWLVSVAKWQFADPGRAWFQIMLRHTCV